MKKIALYTLLAMGLLSGFASCKKYLDDVATNPNDPSSVPPNPMLANIELATFASYNGNLNRRAGVFTQHLAGIDGQYVGVANYKINETDVTNEWKVLYTNALINARILIDKLGTRSPNFKGIVQVLYAINLGVATDMWGDVPNTEALLALKQNFQANYDRQQDIYAFLQSTLSEAIDNLKQSASNSLYFAGGYDYIYGGDIQHWIGLAYALKARYANHLSKISPIKSASDAVMYLDSAYANGFTSAAADANANFGLAANENNQWYAFDNGRGYVRLGAFFVTTMKANNDPRLPFFAAKDAEDDYSGADVDPANASGDESFVGPYYGSPDSKAPIMTFVEAKFIEAEAKLRLGASAAAATAHNSAVKASIALVTGGSAPGYEAGHASETASSITLKKIMTEKYIALFTQSETWTDWRRTGLPLLSPNPSAVVHAIPRILPTSQDERINNPNAAVVSNVLQTMWWDQ